MLEMLVRNRGKLVGQRELLTELWGGPTYVDQTHYLRIYLAQLRHKLEPEPARPPASDHRSGTRLPVRALVLQPQVRTFLLFCVTHSLFLSIAYGIVAGAVFEDFRHLPTDSGS